MAEGRLSADELEERLETLYAARTYGELDALLADVPVNRPLTHRRVRPGRLVAAVSAVALVLAVLGVLAIMRVHSSVAAVGGTRLPGRRLNFPGPHQGPIMRGRSGAVLGTGLPRRLTFPGPLAGPHQELVIAALLGVVFVVLLTSAALVWALMGSSSRGNADWGPGASLDRRHSR